MFFFLQNKNTIILLRNGFGAISSCMPNGDLKRKYIGGWQNDRKSNEGCQYFGDGTYSGEFKNGQRSGNGIMWYNENGCMYIGKWKRDKFHGPGTFFNGLS